MSDARSLIERLVCEQGGLPFGKDGDEDPKDKKRGKKSIKFSKKSGSAVREGEDWGDDDDELMEFAIDQGYVEIDGDEYIVTEDAVQLFEKPYTVKGSLTNLKGRGPLKTTDKRKTPAEVKRAVIAGIFKMHGKRAKGGKKRESAPATAASLIERVADGEDAYSVICDL